MIFNRHRDRFPLNSPHSRAIFQHVFYFAPKTGSYICLSKIFQTPAVGQSFNLKGQSLPYSSCKLDATQFSRHPFKIFFRHSIYEKGRISLEKQTSSCLLDRVATDLLLFNLLPNPQ